MNRAILIVSTMFISCTTAASPQGMKIKTTENPTEVENCIVVDAVEAQPPYI
jgi:hypothetical protein